MSTITSPATDHLAINESSLRTALPVPEPHNSAPLHDGQVATPSHHNINIKVNNFAPAAPAQASTVLEPTQAVAAPQPAPAAAPAAVTGPYSVKKSEFDAAELRLAVDIKNGLRPEFLELEEAKPGEPDPQPLTLTIKNEFSLENPAKTDLQLDITGTIIRPDFSEIGGELIEMLKKHPVIGKLLENGHTCTLQKAMSGDGEEMIQANITGLTTPEYVQLIKSLSSAVSVQPAAAAQAPATSLDADKQREINAAMTDTIQILTKHFSDAMENFEKSHPEIMAHPAAEQKPLVKAAILSDLKNAYAQFIKEYNVLHPTMPLTEAHVAKLNEEIQKDLIEEADKYAAAWGEPKAPATVAAATDNVIKPPQPQAQSQPQPADAGPIALTDIAANSVTAAPTSAPSPAPIKTAEIHHAGMVNGAQLDLGRT